MKQEFKQLLALFIRDNKENKHKINLVEFMQERINFYAKQEKRPDGHIRGMNVLLSDIIELPSNMFEDK